MHPGALRPRPSPVGPGEAAKSGAGRGALAGLLYAAVLTVIFVVDDATGSDPPATSLSDVGANVVFGLLLFGCYATPVGAVGGALLGTACLVPARRMSPRAAAALSGLLVAALGTALFPWVPLGDAADDLGEFLELSLLPGCLAGCAAAWHGWALSRRLRDAGYANGPGR